MPWEFERLQPVELWALAEAYQWRRNRDLEVMAVALLWVLNRMPLHEKGVSLDEILETLPGYSPDKGETADE